MKYAAWLSHKHLGVTDSIVEPVGASCLFKVAVERGIDNKFLPQNILLLRRKRCVRKESGHVHGRHHIQVQTSG